MPSNRADGRTGGRAVVLLAALLSAGPPVRLSAQVIDTVIIVNHNIFAGDGDGPGFVARLANALHVTTRPGVIRRALLLDAGERYDSARAVESERALRNLAVFRDVRVDTVRLGNRLGLRVETADGWSTQPQAGFSTAGGDATWNVGFVEQNLLGTATELDARYRKTPDRSATEFLYRNPHALSRRSALLLHYQHLSDGNGGDWSLGLPFYETAARWSLGTDGEAGRVRVLRFRDGALESTVQRRVLRSGVAGGAALHATGRDYVRWWFGGQWRREDFAPETTSAFPRSVTAAAGTGLEFGHTRLVVLHHFDTYGRREDLDLSQVLRLGLWTQAGFAPEVKGQLSALWRGGFALLRAEAHGLYDGAGLDSGLAKGSFTAASQNLPRQTWIVHVEGGASRRAKPGSEFDLWRDQNGPRVFGAHAFTGTRMVWVAVEDRVLMAENVWGLVGVGIAPFFDYGGAWYADERARLGGDWGLALRLGPTRAVQGSVTEFAVGYRFGAGVVPGHRWALSIRQGIGFR
jgi:hypothetical protein